MSAVLLMIRTANINEIEEKCPMKITSGIFLTNVYKLYYFSDQPQGIFSQMSSLTLFGTPATRSIPDGHCQSNHALDRIGSVIGAEVITRTVSSGLSIEEECVPCGGCFADDPDCEYQ